MWYLKEEAREDADGTADPVPSRRDVTPEGRGAPTVWMRALRWHTYHGRPQGEHDIYLCHEDEVDNIETLKFARRIPSPPIIRH